MTVFIDGIKVIQDTRELCNALEGETEIGIDTETTGLSPWRNNLALMQFYGKNTNALGVIQTRNGVVPDDIKKLFTPDKLFIAHNAVSFDLMFLHQADVPWDRAKWYDTFVGETVVVSTGRHDVSKSLAATARRRLGKTINKDIEHGHWADPELTDRQLEYAAQDVISLPAMMASQWERAEETKQKTALIMETQLMPSVAKMTINGMPVKRVKMEEFIRNQYDELDKYEYDLYEKLGEINLNSHTQIKRAMREKYNVIWQSTAEDALLDVVEYKTGDEAEIAQMILDFRTPAQRIKMYSPEWMDTYIDQDWIHPRFWQCSANTGRFTCSNPNLQQWPRDARWLVGNLEGYKIVKADLSQIEVRVAAYVAQDAELLKALEFEDIHMSIAAALFNVPLSSVTKEQRRMAKAPVFAQLYCGGPTRLFNEARHNGFPIEFSAAEHIYTEFFSRFQGLRAMRNKAIAMSKNNRMVSIRMPNNLRRILTGADNRPSVILNNTVQGFAAVCLKQGILEASAAGFDDYMGGQIHDELVAVVRNEYAEDAAEELKKAMLKGAAKWLPIPLGCKADTGVTWS
jgi:DNA polymerase I-like protein with 3'-5' exonuclease and polymerase domains